MLLKPNGIYDVVTWKALAPPMGGDKQWVDGRSAKELAKYMTKSLPTIPGEIAACLDYFVEEKDMFEWNAEYVTDFASKGLGKGNGRNHDAILYNEKVFVGIEGKADEPLGSQRIGEAYDNGSSNKKKRIEGLTKMIFGNTPDEHRCIRYQLLTASTAILLEAEERGVNNALFLIIVFKKHGAYSQDKLLANQNDIDQFLSQTNAFKVGDLWKVPTQYGQQNGIDLYFTKIEIDV